MTIMICSVFLWHLCYFVFFSVSVVLSFVFLLCCVVCRFTLANKPLKSGTAKCITSRPTFKSGTARAVPLRYVPTPLVLAVMTVYR